MRVLSLFTAILLTTVFSMNVQGQNALSQGTWLVSGVFSFNTSGSKVKVDGDAEQLPRSFSFNVMPAAGVFVSDRVVVGGTAGFNSLIIKEVFYDFNGDKTGKTRDGIHIVSFGPFVRVYKPIGQRQFAALFANLSMIYGPSWGKSVVKPEDGDKETNRDFDAHNIAMALSAGVEFWPSDCISLGVGFGVFGFSLATAKDGDVRATNTDIALAWDLLGLNIGVNYFFGYKGGGASE